MATFRTSHFKFYRVVSEGRPGGIGVSLRGQFEPAGASARRHAVVYQVFFGNPVSKNQEPIGNPDTHLNWYLLRGSHEPRREVRVDNQFGKQNLLLGDPELLLVPAWKQDGVKPLPTDPPTDVSHFKGYRVLQYENFEPRTVSLRDQFDRKTLGFWVDAPAYLCVPVEKTVGRTVTKRVYPNEHLTIYPIRPVQSLRMYKGPRRVRDQFKESVLRDFRPYFLGVPSFKRYNPS